MKRHLPKRNDSGLFITIEGGEGSGKSTLSERLYQYLTDVEKRFVLKTFEPGGTPFGKMMRKILLDNGQTEISSRSELMLFLADRANHVDTLIKPALDDDMIVICDRFSDSSIAYQGAARQLKDFERLEDVCQFAAGDFVPDVTFYLDLDPKVAFARIKRDKDRLENESFEFHSRVREGYLKLAKEHKDRIFVIDASQNEEEVFQKALARLKVLLKKENAIF